MLYKLKVFFCMVLLMLITTFYQLHAQEQQQQPPLQLEQKGKKRVAVLPFNTAGIEQWWLGSHDPGLAMSEYIVHELVNSGQYTVIERENIDKIFREHKVQSEKNDDGRATCILEGDAVKLFRAVFRLVLLNS